MNTSNKMLVVYFFYLLIALLAVGKIVYLQFFSDYKNQLESIVYRTTEIPAGRGSILGYDGRVLATTVPFYEIRMDCSIPDDDMLNRNLRALAVSLSRMFEDKSATDYEKYIATARTTKKPGYRNLPLGNRLVSHDELLEIRGFQIGRASCRERV